MFEIQLFVQLTLTLQVSNITCQYTIRDRNFTNSTTIQTCMHLEVQIMNIHD